MLDDQQEPNEELSHHKMSPELRLVKRWRPLAKGLNGWRKVEAALDLTLCNGSQVNVSILVFNGERHDNATVLTSGYLWLFLTAQTRLRSVKASQAGEGGVGRQGGRKGGGGSPENTWTGRNLLLELHTSVPHLQRCQSADEC